MALRQFDICENLSLRQRGAAPYLVRLSSHLILDLHEVVVAPVVRAGLLESSALDVAVFVDDEPFTVSVLGMAALRDTDLKSRAGSLIAYEFDIRCALDRLFTGF